MESSFKDQNLVCADCQGTFVFTAGEQEFFSTKGFSNTPKRCPDCRSKRKAQSRRGGGGGGGFSKPRGGGGGGFSRPRGGHDRGGERETFPAVCSRCQASFDAPFRPKEGLPIYCRDCFKLVK